MSRRVTRANFEGTRKLWLDAYEHVGPRELPAWSSDWATALRDLPYVHLVRTQTDTIGEAMLIVKLASHFPLGSAEAVEADIESVWSANLAHSLRSYHAVVPTDDGLNFLFMCLTDQDRVVTGVVVVTKV